MQKNKEAIVWGITPPGAFLEEKIQEMGIDVNDFAARIGYTPKTVNEILKGKCCITIEDAHSLDYATGIPVSFWLNAQKGYEEELMRLQVKEAVKNQAGWRKFFPIGELNPRTLIKDFNN